MARRNNNQEEGGLNLDSLMDALTNVVAVLILVLLLVQANVTQKIQAFIEDLEPATQEQVDLKREELEKLKALLAKKTQQLKEEPPPPEEIEREKLELEKLEKDIDLNKDLLVDLDKLKELEKKLRSERDAAKEKTNLIQEEISKLEGMLDATPVLKAPPPEEVTIPNSRPIPQNAEIYYALVFGGRVHVIDPFTPVEQFNDEFNKHKRDFLIERVSQKGADRYIYDQQKIVDHFSKFKFGGGKGQSITIPPNKYGARLQIIIVPDEKAGGSSLEDLGKPGSEFEKVVKSLSSNRRAVLLFWVNPDSFNTYLVARKLADNAKIPAGWEVRADKAFGIVLADVEVKPLEEPPPPPPQPEKPATPPPAPPPLQPKLD
ncbi:MAG: hypothetical protein EHM17_15445 [Verrucomicrobiaceae bacterium]|nr:MAG: hypothetical protein EHM17_15445 [Verrucomicrobiaceae bacterium]